MSRITPLDPAEATGHSKQLLDVVQANLGATPNMMKVMARSAVLEAYLNLSSALAKGSVRPATAERIALGVAESNQCGYCLSAHTYLGEHVAKLSGEELEHAREFKADDPKAAAILAFARAVTADAGEVSDEEFEAARSAGLSDAELADTVGHVAINVLTNYFNKAFEVDIDFPVVQPHRAAV